MPQRRSYLRTICKRCVAPDAGALWAFYCLAVGLFVGLCVTAFVGASRFLAANGDILPTETLDVAQHTLRFGFILSLAVVFLIVLVIFRPAHLAIKRRLEWHGRQLAALRRAKQRLLRRNKSLSYQVNHDPLTGLPNRSFLIEYLVHALAERALVGQSLLSIGVDRFKAINDSVGHATGDMVLVAIGNLLKSCVDDTNFVSRIGGDEFVMISDEPVATLIHRITSSLSGGVEADGHRVAVRLSIGHLEITESMVDPHVLIADAGVAMQSAKNAGGNRAQPFNEQLCQTLGLQKALQLELRDAIRNGEITPWFQPQIRLVDGHLHGAEVLARWHHPERGILTPDIFLPAAAKAGLTVELDHAVWAAAMRCGMDWQSEGLWRPVISLNASPETISDPHMIEKLLKALFLVGLDANQVIIEVLETTLISSKSDMAAINIDGLAECGIALELDDFGTGYASLSKLTQLPLAGIKLDRSLVAPLPDQAADSVVRAILALAAELGLQVIAEGIEETVQAQHLNKHGCGIGQGYGFGRPMPPDTFAAWLAGQKRQVPESAASLLLPRPLRA